MSRPKPRELTYLATGVYIWAAITAPVKSKKTTIMHKIQEMKAIRLFELFFLRFHKRNAQANMMIMPPIIRKAGWPLIPPVPAYKEARSVEVKGLP